MRRVKGWVKIFSTGFGERLRQLRKAKGLTQKQLGEAAGMGERAVQKYEAGTDIPIMDNLARLADVLDLSLDELVGRERGER
jgi:transcriptional regulator with XRE-family HTH domain